MSSLPCLQILYKLEDREASMDRLYDMDDKEIGALIRHPHGGKVLYMICLLVFCLDEISVTFDLSF